MQAYYSIVAAKRYCYFQQYVILIAASRFAGVLGQGDVEDFGTTEIEVHHLTCVAISREVSQLVAVDVGGGEVVGCNQVVLHGLGEATQIAVVQVDADFRGAECHIVETHVAKRTVAIIGRLSAIVACPDENIMRIGDQSQDLRNKLIVDGIVAWMAAQVMTNVASMIGLIPLTGVTLPLISYGGSSMMIVSVALGIVMAISEYTGRRNISETERDGNIKNPVFSTVRRRRV